LTSRLRAPLEHSTLVRCHVHVFKSHAQQFRHPKLRRACWSGSRYRPVPAAEIRGSRAASGGEERKHLSFGKLADIYGLQASFFLTVISELYVLFYALWGCRNYEQDLKEAARAA
jgi:hypothetical protein